MSPGFNGAGGSGSLRAARQIVKPSATRANVTTAALTVGAWTIALTFPPRESFRLALVCVQINAQDCRTDKLPMLLGCRISVGADRRRWPTLAAERRRNPPPKNLNSVIDLQDRLGNLILVSDAARRRTGVITGP